MPLWDVKLAVAEFQRGMTLGHKSLSFPNAPETLGLPGLADPHWEPLWSAVEEAGVPREWFGQHKMAGGFVIPKLLESNRPAAMALRAHYRKIQRRFASEPVLAHKRAERAPHAGPIPTAGAFRFGWAVEAIRPRYRSPRAG